MGDKMKKYLILFVLLIISIFIDNWKTFNNFDAVKANTKVNDVAYTDNLDLKSNEILAKQKLTVQREIESIKKTDDLLPVLAPNVKSMPSISAQAAITLDADSNTIIFNKNMNSKMYPASTTKLTTAILLAENKKTDSLLIYSANAKAQEPVKLDLAVGDKMSADDAMTAMLLNSDNDIAYMIAENVAGSSSNFAALMNNKVQQLHLKNTHFVTPNGLPNPNHYTTAYDYSIIAREVYKYKWVMDTLAKSSAQIHYTDNKNICSKALYTYNELLGKNGCIGGKTGYTESAGKCLVEYYKRNGVNMIGIIFKEPDDTTLIKDMNTIINFSYQYVSKNK